MVTYLSGGRIQGRSDDDLVASPVTQTPANEDASQGLGGGGGNITKVGFLVSTGFGLVGLKVKYITIYAYKYGSPTGNGVMKAYVGTTEVATSTNSFDLAGLGIGSSNWTTLKFEFTPFTVLDDTSFMLEGGSTGDGDEVTVKAATPNEFSNIQWRRYQSGSWVSNAAVDPWLVYETTTDKSKTSITDVPAGTRYEETDTRKIFRREIGALDNTTGLKAYYKFNETEGDIINQQTTGDGLGSAADMTISGATYSQTGKVGNALSFDGSNDYGELGSSLSQWNFLHGTGDWSMNFWLNTVAFASEKRVMTNVDSSETRGFTIRVDSSTSIALSIKSDNGWMSNGGLALNQTMSTGTWYMITLVADYSASPSYQIYVNGDAEGTRSRAVAGSTGNAEHNMDFARRGSENDGHINALFDEMSIWSRVLTTSEITALYASGNGITLASSWKEKGTA